MIFLDNGYEFSVWWETAEKLIGLFCLFFCLSICELTFIQNFEAIGKEDNAVRSRRVRFFFFYVLLLTQLKCETEAISSLCAYASLCVSVCNWNRFYPIIVKMENVLQLLEGIAMAGY